jgi:hypothetical protein
MRSEAPGTLSKLPIDAVPDALKQSKFTLHDCVVSANLLLEGF